MSPKAKVERDGGRRKWDGIKTVLAWSGVLALVTSGVVGYVAITTAKHAFINTERLDRSICAQVLYLEGIATNPKTDPRNARAIKNLIRELRKDSSSCPLG